MVANQAPSFFIPGTGRVATPIGLGNSRDEAYGVTVQPDGKIVVVGRTDGPGGTDIALVRYNVDGSLDTGFGPDGTGKVVTAVGSGTSIDIGHAVGVQADGKIVVAGRADGPEGIDFAVLRYNVDGSLDTGFGPNGTGKVVTPVGSGSAADEGHGLVLLADGRILVAGYAQDSNGDGDFALVRYRADGSLDTGFGPNGTGKVTTPVSPGSADDIGFGLAVQADGRIVVAGFAWGSGFGGPSGGDFALARYNSDGSLDTSFGPDETGKVTTPVGAGASFDYGQSVVLQADGRIVVAGYADGAPNDSDFALVRYHPDGSLDTSFGADKTGKVITSLGDATSKDDARSVLVQADGKIVVAGSARGPDNSADFALVRYNVDGTLDTGFGPNGTGKVLTPMREFGTTDIAFNVTLQADGRIVIVGSTTGASLDFALVRYNVDGSLDTSFGGTNTLGGAVAFTEGGPPVRLDADVAVSDPELDALNGGQGDYAGASITLLRQGGADAQDQFDFAPQGFSVSDDKLLTPGGQAFATVTRDAGTLTVTFTGTGTATFALANAAMRAITYTNVSDAPPTRAVLAWTFSDGNAGAQGSGGAKGTTGFTTVEITAVNDAPLLAGDGAIDVERGGRTVLTLADLTATDVDSPVDLLTYTVTAAQGGQVLVTGAAATSFTQMQLASGEVSFQEDGSGSTPSGFTVTVSDGIDASTPKTVTATVVTPPPQPPVTPPQPPVVPPQPPEPPVTPPQPPVVTTGTAGNDILRGGAGDDRIDGGAGVDALFVGADRADIVLTRNADGTLTLAGPGLGTDQVRNVEILRFDDRVELAVIPDGPLTGELPFDEARYLADNPDVAAAVASGQFASGRAHFDRFGQAEGRTVTIGGFDETFYLAQNPDVAAAVSQGIIASALDHYVRFGAAEGRDPNALFDETWYLETYADVGAAVRTGTVESAYDHFRAFGWREGRDPSQWMETQAYLDANPDLAAADVNPLDHYLDYGAREGRAIQPVGNDMWMT